LPGFMGRGWAFELFSNFALRRCVGCRVPDVHRLACLLLRCIYSVCTRQWKVGNSVVFAAPPPQAGASSAAKEKSEIVCQPLLIRTWKPILGKRRQRALNWLR